MNCVRSHQLGAPVSDWGCMMYIWLLILSYFSVARVDIISYVFFMLYISVDVDGSRMWLCTYAYTLKDGRYMSSRGCKYLLFSFGWPFCAHVSFGHYHGFGHPCTYSKFGVGWASVIWFWSICIFICFNVNCWIYNWWQYRKSITDARIDVCAWLYTGWAPGVRVSSSNVKTKPYA